tara:strand:+ start:280 stop:738 length:459 start_codon:yes stop_codon:yes gene_type:complete
MNICIYCSTETSNPKFCSRSCSASYNNRGVRRHGKDVLDGSVCIVCNKNKSRKNKLYCSKKCYFITLKKSLEHHRCNNAYRQSKYRAKQYRKISSDASVLKIRNIYQNCPDGYEVDHIIPLSKGGKHHENNLQYLTIQENRSKSNKLNWCSS